MQSSKVLLFGLLCCFVIAINAKAYWSDDLETAASGHSEEWKKGGGKDHHEDHHESHGDKGKLLIAAE